MNENGKPATRTILLVTPYFAPQTHAAMFRAHKLAKYLPEFGWKPIVLTVDTNYLYNEDKNLLDDLPEEVEIIRTRYVEPSVRGVRMALGGPDRTFVAMKDSLAPIKPAIQPGSAAGRNRGSLLRSAYHSFLRQIAYSPDAYWTWKRGAIKAARQLIDAQQIDIVYTTSVPFTTLDIGMSLQSLGHRWVADFRDPATYASKVSSSSELIRKRQRKRMEMALSNADAITTTSSSYGPIFADMYGDITKRPICFIPTGMDQAYVDHDQGVAALTRLNKPYVLYAGEIMPEQSMEFLHIWRHAEMNGIPDTDIVIVGHESINRSRLSPLINEAGVQSNVHFTDHVPQRDLYALIRGAEATLLIPGRQHYWWNNHAKLVDYVGLSKSVLAVVPDPSEARSVLQRANLGVFLDGSEEHAAGILAQFLRGELTLGEPVEEVCNQYLAATQVESFARLFDELVAKRD